MTWPKLFEFDDQRVYEEELLCKAEGLDISISRQNKQLNMIQKNFKPGMYTNKTIMYL